MDRFRWSILAVIVAPICGTAFLPDFGIPAHFFRTKIDEIYSKICHFMLCMFNTFVRTCSSSVMVPTSGKPSTTRAIIVINAILEYVLTEYLLIVLKLNIDAFYSATFTEKDKKETHQNGLELVYLYI